MLNTSYIPSKGKKGNKLLSLNWEHIITVFMAFFISRASIIDKLTPFGIAFMSSYILAGKYNWYIMISTILGILSFHGLGGIDYVISIVLISILHRTKNAERLSRVKSSVVTATVFIVVKILYTVLFNQIFIYDILLIAFEGLIIFSLSYMFSYSVISKTNVKFSNNERIISTFITAAIVLSGFHNINLYGISVKNIICSLLILYFGYSKGALVGSAIGITLGIISYIARPEMPFILAIYGLAGLLAGTFKELGKAGSVLGFLLGNSIISFYVNGYGVSFLSWKELMISAGIFSITYGYLNDWLYLYIGDITNRSKEKSYSYRKDQITIEKLNDIAEVFNELGQAFKKSIEYNRGYDVTEVYELIDNLANSVCCNCSLRRFCWEEKFYTTYHSMFKIIGLIEGNIPVEDSTIPNFIKEYCINRKEVLKELRQQYEKLKINDMWKEKIIQNRLLVSEQLEEVAKIMKDMAKDIYINPTFKEDVEELIFEELKRNRIDVVDVVVMELEKDNIEIYVEVDNRYNDTNCYDKVKKIVSDVLAMPVNGEFNVNRSKDERQKFKFVKGNRYSALTEILSKPNYMNKISGDSYTFGEGTNIYYSAISDGMGAGKKANNESNMAINLLEKFIEAKFDKELALRTINSILMLKSNEEMFTTFDISLIDLYSGKLQLIKTGAPATFIKKKDRVEIINSQSLPVGILKDVDFNVYEEYLEDGDIIIMMSDGVLDANEETDNAELWMKDLISKIDSVNPKTIGEMIISAASEVCGSKPKDDMTVMVTKVWKTVG